MKNVFKSVSFVFIAIALIIVCYLLLYPFVYEGQYFEKIGTNGAVWYKDIVYFKGNPVKQEKTNDEFLAYYDGLTLVFDKTGQKLIRSEITGKQYRFGLRSIGVGSTRKQVEIAYTNVKKIIDLDKDEFGAIDNRVWVDFKFDSNEKVERILLYYGP